MTKTATTVTKLVWIFKLGWNLLVQMAHVPDLSPQSRLVLWLRKHRGHQLILSPLVKIQIEILQLIFRWSAFWIYLFPWTDILFRSFGETAVCAACVPCFFLAVYRPVSHTVSLSQVCAGHINGSDCGGTRPAAGVLDLLWLSFCASVYLPGSGILSHKVVFQSDAVTFNFNIFLTFFPHSVA